MITIVASTNRPDSKSRKLANLYKRLLEEKGHSANVLSLEDMPKDYIESALYENSGKDETFNKLRKQMEDSRRFFFIIPEYNGSFPGVLKIFIDGLKYPDSIKGKKAALAGLSSGSMGTALGLSHFTDVLNYLGCSVFANKPRYFNIEKSFDGENFTNKLYEEVCNEQIDKFLEF